MREHKAVAKAVIEQISDQLAEHDAAHRAAKTHQAGDRATTLAWKQIGRQNHDQRGPRLLPEIREAEEHNRPGNRNVRDTE